MIFKTFENNDIDKWTAKIGLFGKNFNDVIDSINKRKLDIDNLMSSGLVSSYSDAKNQVGGVFSYLHPNKKDIKSQLIDVNSVLPKIDENQAKSILQQISDIENGVNEEITSFQELYNTGNKQKQWIAKYAQETQGQIRSTDDLISANEKARASAIAHNNALKQQTLGAKAATIAMKGLTMVGNMLFMFAATKALELIVKAIDDYVHRLDNAKEALESTQSELESVNKEIDETTSKIKELESMDNLSITDKEDLEQLKLQNEELRIRQKYLEAQEQKDKEKVAKYTEQSYRNKYGESVDRSDIDKYKESYNTPKSQTASTYLTGGSNTTSTPYGAGQQSQEQEEGNRLAELIAKYEYYSDLKKKAIQDEDSEAIEKYNKKLESISDNLSENRTELQGFKDDIEASGEASPYLEEIKDKLKLIDDTLLSPGQNLVNFINSEELDGDKEKLIELANSGKLTQDELEKNFSNVNDYLKENGLTLEDLIGIIKIYQEELENVPNDTSILSTDELKEKISDLNSAIESIQSAYDTLNSAVEEYNSNGGQLSIDTIQSLLSLSDEYLACLQVENGQLSLNADAMAQLAQAKLDEAQATAVTQAMTELQAIANGEAAQSTTNYITGNAALMSSLAQLSGSYEGVAQAAMTAAQAQELSAQISAASAKDKTATENVMKGLDTKLKLIQSTKNAISAGNFASVSKKTSKSGSSSKSSKSSKDELKEAFETEYNLLKHNLEMETITEKEYYDGVQALNEKYFAGKEEYLDEYRKYEEEVYKGLKSYYKSYCDDMMDYWDKALAANKMSLKQFVNDAKALFDKLHNAGNLSDEDYWNYMSDYYQKQIDYMDKVVSAVDKVIDDEIDKLEDQKSKVESYYQNQIDLLNKQKEALEKANEARQKAIDLQKKQYELERAKNQRSDLMYKDNQFVYVANDQNIRDKQSDLDDAQYQMKIQEIENQISSLEDKMDELTGNIDKQIDDLNAYKDQWDSVAEQFGYAQDQIIASEVLGQGYEEEILAMRQDILDNFTNSYIDLQQNQVNAAWAAANSIIESINAQITALNALKEAQGIAGSSPLASTGGSAVNERDSVGVSENSSNEKNNKSQKNGDYWTYKNLGSFNTSGEASSQIGMLGGDSVISVGGRYAVVKWIRGYKTAKIAHQRMSSENASGFYRRYASGTDNAEKGWHIVSEDNIGDEIVIDNNGNAVIPHGEQLYNFQGGEQVIPADESKEIIENQGNVEKIPTKVVLGDGTVLTPVSHVMEISDSIRQSMMKNVALPNNIGQRNYENLMKNANNISNVNNNQPTDNSISIGEIHLHEVRNVDEFSKAIIHKLPGKMRQALYSR